MDLQRIDENFYIDFKMNRVIGFDNNYRLEINFNDWTGKSGSTTFAIRFDAEKDKILWFRSGYGWRDFKHKQSIDGAKRLFDNYTTKLILD